MTDYKKLYEDANKRVAIRFGSDVARELFPDLYESEDEKIRKAIHIYLDWLDGRNKDYHPKGDYTIRDMIAWLEKQGQNSSILSNSANIGKDEQNPVQETEPTPIFRVGDTLKRKGKDYTFIVDRIQGGFYHCDHGNGAFFPIEGQDNWELVEQKPAWSEEDEHRSKDAIYFLETARRHYASTVEIDACIDWLKSLKDRILI